MISAFDPFITTTYIVLALLAIEVIGLFIVGLTSDSLIQSLIQTDNFPEGSWDNFLIVRGVPFSVVVILILGAFSAVGAGMQYAHFSLTGSYLDAVLASCLAVVPAWAISRFISLKLRPLFEGSTSVISLKELIGKKAEVTSTSISKGNMGEAKIFDSTGTIQYVNIVSAHSDLIVGDQINLDELNVDTSVFTVTKLY